MRSAVKGMMAFWPQPLRQLLEGSRHSEAGDAAPPKTESGLSAEQAGLRKDALLGHLLKLAARAEEGSSLPPHALLALLGQLVSAGLLPRCFQSGMQWCYNFILLRWVYQ